MNKNVAEVVFYIRKNGQRHILELPLHISANELVLALNQAYDLQIDISDIKKCYLKAENPIALLRGNKTLEEYGIRNGSAIYYTEQGQGYGRKI